LTNPPVLKTMEFVYNFSFWEKDTLGMIL